MISTKTVNVAGLAAGAAIGIGVGAASMHFSGRTQEKVDHNARVANETEPLRAQRAERDLKLRAQQAQLNERLGSGEAIPDRERREIERTLREIDVLLNEHDDSLKDQKSETWPLFVGGGLAVASGITSSVLDKQLNYSFKNVLVKRGSQMEFIGVPIGRGDKYKLVRDAPIARHFTPSLAAGLAIGLAAGLGGVALLQQKRTAST